MEPYLFLSNHNEVRCYELKSGQNKTFKVSRMGRVEVLDLLWCNEQHHTQVYTDLFHFSGETRYPVTLRLGVLSVNLLKEEYPQSVRWLQPDDKGHWLLHTEVCSLQGVARFVMGLYEDVEVIDSPELQQFLNRRVQELSRKRW